MSGVAQFIAENPPIPADELPARATSYWCTEGDSFFYVNDHCPSFADRVDGVLTVFRARDNHRIVAVQVKGARRLLETMGGFEVDIQCENPVKYVISALMLGFKGSSARSVDALQRYEEPLKWAMSLGAAA